MLHAPACAPLPLALFTLATDHRGTDLWGELYATREALWASLLCEMDAGQTPRQWLLEVLGNPPDRSTVWRWERRHSTRLDLTNPHIALALALFLSLYHDGHARPRGRSVWLPARAHLLLAGLPDQWWLCWYQQRAPFPHSASPRPPDLVTVYQASQQQQQEELVLCASPYQGYGTWPGTNLAWQVWDGLGVMAWKPHEPDWHALAEWLSPILRLLLIPSSFADPPLALTEAITTFLLYRSGSGILRASQAVHTVGEEETEEEEGERM